MRPFCCQATFAVPPSKPVEPVVKEHTSAGTEAVSKGSPSKRKREDEEPVTTAEGSTRKGKKGKKGKKDAAAPVEDAVAATPIEETPVAPVPADDAASVASAMDQDAADDESDLLDSDADGDNEFVHESKKSPSGEKDKRKKQKKIKFVPEEESKTDRDRRTIFIGNLPVETAKSKVCLGVTW